MDFFAFALMRYDVSKKGNKLCASVPYYGFAQYSPSLSVKGSVQSERAVAVVLKTVTFGPFFLQRQHGINTVKCLNRRLFVHTKNRRMGRRIEIQPDDIGRLHFKVRISKSP